MARGIEIRPQVYLDLAEASDYLAERSLAAAQRFLSAAELTFEWLRQHPKAAPIAGFEHPLAAGIRIWKVKGFRNYLIFYQDSDAGIEVVRVLHGARDIAAIFSGD